ncbi:hypothetical protein PAXRUDRAFT_21779 [Paxillus rubicundulus Ve08.2h10]|uniref:Uncharacterized protein n=1 Tax=Paxillus rubicundulus Ve08.2h10 TaxID=930991 RepID=A0A0D0CAK3_9AGAM|nr:hypothetical protein PAXRUDRAFT_21779 [Paxillus rubicundulus Ve08.2h10]
MPEPSREYGGRQPEFAHLWNEQQGSGGWKDHILAQWLHLDSLPLLFYDRLTANILLINLDIFLLLTLLVRNSFSLSLEIPLLTSSEQDHLLAFGLMGQPQIPNWSNLRINQFGRIRELFQIIWQTIFMDEFIGIYQQPPGNRAC